MRPHTRPYAGLAYDDRHRQAVTVVIIGYERTGCQTMTSRYTSHLVADAVSAGLTGRCAKLAASGRCTDAAGLTRPGGPEAHGLYQT